MTFTRATIVTWASNEDQVGSADLTAERQALVAKLVSQGKTDGIYYPVSPTSTRRYWIDQSAAEEYAAGLSAIAAKYSKKLVKIEIVAIS